MAANADKDRICGVIVMPRTGRSCCRKAPAFIALAAAWAIVAGCSPPASRAAEPAGAGIGEPGRAEPAGEAPNREAASGENAPSPDHGPPSGEGRLPGGGPQPEDGAQKPGDVRNDDDDTGGADDGADDRKRAEGGEPAGENSPSAETDARRNPAGAEVRRKPEQTEDEPKPAAGQPARDGDNVLKFGDLYASVGVRGVRFSDKVLALTGEKVEMTGYMAPPLTAGARFFVLTKALMAVCPFCSTDEDWPADIVVVYLPDGDELRPTEHPVKVTGTLETGSYTDEETGFVSLVRIRADRVEVLD